jgi:hypothetical protein
MCYFLNYLTVIACWQHFFGTSLVYDEAKEIANRSGPLLKQSWRIDQLGIAADGAELMLIRLHQQKVIYRVRVLYKYSILESLFSF